MLTKWKEERKKERQEIDQMFKDYFNDKKVVFEEIDKIKDEHTKTILKILITRLFNY